MKLLTFLFLSVTFSFAQPQNTPDQNPFPLPNPQIDPSDQSQQTADSPLTHQDAISPIAADQNISSDSILTDPNVAPLLQPFIIPSPAPTAAANVDPAIQRICDSTDYPGLCLTTIPPLLQEGKSDVVSALEMAIRAAVMHVRVAIPAATKFSSLPKISNPIATALSDCKDQYNDALDNLESAVDAIPQNDIGTVNSMLSAAITDFSTCEDGFMGENSPLVDFDSKLTKMTSNCLAIASLVK